jgi:uncharacterized protein YjdB
MKKNLWRFAAVLAASSLVLAVAGCGGGKKKNTPVVSVTLNLYTKSLVTVRDDAGFTLTAGVLPANASNRTVTWSVTGDTGAVKLEGAGPSVTVKPLAKGKAYITANADGVDSEPCTVTVTPEGEYTAVTSVSLDCKDEEEIMVDRILIITAALIPGNATIQDVTWEITQTGSFIAEVEKGGLMIKVKGLAEGEAVVKVKTEDGGKTAECTISVAPKPPGFVDVTGVTLNKANETLEAGGTLELTATVAPENATEQGVTWSVSGDDAVTLPATTGKTITVTGVSAGTAVITVTTVDGGKQASASIEVTESGGANQATVTFHSNGGSSVSSSTVDKNDTVAEPSGVTNPSTKLREGFYLGGWYKEPGLINKWNFATDKVTADTDLYAGWFPRLSTTEWRRIGPADGEAGVSYRSKKEGNPDDLISRHCSQGMIIDPVNPNVVYAVTVSHGGIPRPENNNQLFKNGILRSTDRGATWDWLFEMYDTQLNGYAMPVNIRIDPVNPKRMYVVEMINCPKGFHRSDDGGETWEQPAGFKKFITDNNLHTDLYHIELDPNNHEHLLITTKGNSNGWGQKKWAGIESFDGGDNWSGVKRPDDAVNGNYVDSGYGWDMWFLYNPVTKSGADGRRFLLGTQDGVQNDQGFFLTEDGGETWERVVDHEWSKDGVRMYHGGGGVYYDEDGNLYLAGTTDYKGHGQIMKSTDNGKTWASFNAGFDGYSTFLNVIGYNGYLYAGDSGQFWRTRIAGGPDWKKNTPPTNNNGWDNKTPWPEVMLGGAFEFCLDPENKILYASCVDSGVYALQLE